MQHCTHSPLRMPGLHQEIHMAYTLQAAEKAAAQSDREINGYRIESISVTHDRHTHYQRQAVPPSQVPAAHVFTLHSTVENIACYD